MPSLADHQSTRSTKVLFIGDSGTGKTGALTSLVKAGYKLRILDFDNGLDSLVGFIRAQCPENLGNVEYETLRDPYKSTPAGPVLAGQPKAFIQAMTLLDKWTDGTKPSEWDDKTVLVVDSLTFLSNAAMNWAEVFKPSKDRRQIYGEAQRAVETALSQLTSESFKPNVIIIAHMTYMERDDGTKKAYPTAAGQALSPKIPSYFNNVIMCESVGTGASARPRIRTTRTSMVDLKNPAPLKVPENLPIETGLADFFAYVRGEK